MSNTEILEELPKLTKTERHEIRLKLAELDGEAWFDEDDPLTADEKALLEARLAAYEKGLTRAVRGKKSKPASAPTSLCSDLHERPLGLSGQRERLKSRTPLFVMKAASWA